MKSSIDDISHLGNTGAGLGGWGKFAKEIGRHSKQYAFFINIIWFVCATV